MIRLRSGFIVVIEFGPIELVHGERSMGEKIRPQQAIDVGVTRRARGPQLRLFPDLPQRTGLQGYSRQRSLREMSGKPFDQPRWKLDRFLRCGTLGKFQHQGFNQRLQQDLGARSDLEN